MTVPPVSIPGSTWLIMKLLTVWMKEGISICVNQSDPYLLESDREGILENAILSVQFTISKIWVILKCRI